MVKRSLIIGLVVIMALAVPLTAFAARGEGSVHAEGDGRVYVRGDGWVDISGRGLLIIVDLAGDAAITVNHNTPESEASLDTEATAAATEHFPDARGSRLVFRRFDGAAHVEGSHIVVIMRGRDIVLDAEGQGVVRLHGRGTYTFNGESGEWSAVGTALEIGGGVPAKTK